MKLQIIQLSSDPLDVKEIKSYTDLQKLNIDYIRHINPNFTDLPPSNLAFGNASDIKMEKKYDEWGLTPPHYGCFKSHTQAIASAMCKPTPTLICENDVHIPDINLMSQKIKIGSEYMVKNKYKILRFETPTFNNEKNRGCYRQLTDELWESNRMIGAYCYMVNPNFKNWWLDTILNKGWHAWDIFLNHIFQTEHIPMLSFKEYLTDYYRGGSIIDPKSEK
tara:strand:+ start:643 stop:1305 length:663 start_codon:yes stop_codon:yes gene_type:complete